ncbi:MAG: hypothetical protein FJ291_05880 [Planctomycetes bacterium]|nr:hypothetical protein [Planctomycetota bacterium]
MAHQSSSGAGHRSRWKAAILRRPHPVNTCARARRPSLPPPAARRRSRPWAACLPAARQWSASASRCTGRRACGLHQRRSPFRDSSACGGPAQGGANARSPFGFEPHNVLGQNLFEEARYGEMPRFRRLAHRFSRRGLHGSDGGGEEDQQRHQCDVALRRRRPIAATAMAGDWPHWAGPEGDCTTDEKGLLKAWPKEGPPVLWRIPIGTGSNHPSVAGDDLCFGQLDTDDRHETIRCVDANTGKERWSHTYEVPPIYHVGWGELGVRATPTITDQRVYEVGTFGHGFCFERKTGKIVWQHDANLRLRRPDGQDRLAVRGGVRARLPRPRPHHRQRPARHVPRRGLHGVPREPPMEDPQAGGWQAGMELGVHGTPGSPGVGQWRPQASRQEPPSGCPERLVHAGDLPGTPLRPHPRRDHLLRHPRSRRRLLYDSSRFSLKPPRAIGLRDVAASVPLADRDLSVQFHRRDACGYIERES